MDETWDTADIANGCFKIVLILEIVSNANMEITGHSKKFALKLIHLILNGRDSVSN